MWENFNTIHIIDPRKALSLFYMQIQVSASVSSAVAIFPSCTCVVWIRNVFTTNGAPMVWSDTSLRHCYLEVEDNDLCLCPTKTWSGVAGDFLRLTIRIVANICLLANAQQFYVWCRGPFFLMCLIPQAGTTEPHQGSCRLESINYVLVLTLCSWKRH